VELYTVMVLACYFKLGARRTAYLTAASVFLVLLANSVRAVALILFDRIAEKPELTTLLSSYEPAVHLGVGVLAFLATAVTSVLIATKLSLRPERNEIISPVQTLAPAPAVHSSRRPAWSLVLLYSMCIGAAIVPLFARTTDAVQLSSPAPAWPKEILGHSVIAVHSLDEEKAFASEFPGHMRRFTDGNNSYFVRIVNKETRQLHPSSDCFKGLGYSIEAKPLVVSADGSRWSSFVARKGNDNYMIMEQLHDSNGHSWSDVSEWYWHALMHESEGPWWDITVASPL
jgi:hypothetical protein